jgi:hypothetical protein
MRRVLERSIIVLAVVLSTSMAHGADGISGTWSSGVGPNEQTFVFRVQGTTFIGILCGPCDDPATVFRIVDGRILDGERLTFSIVRDDGGQRFKELGPYRDHVSGTLSGTQLALQIRRESGSESASRMVLNRVLRRREASLAIAAPPSSSAIDGRWVSVGRVAQQNATLKVRGNKISGVICGPCDDPDGVFLIEDGVLDGNDISFYIHHIDTPVASVQKNGPGRNFMKGTISGNVIRFKWVREGRESEPGGEMVFIGPIR